MTCDTDMFANTLFFVSETPNKKKEIIVAPKNPRGDTETAWRAHTHYFLMLRAVSAYL